MEGTVLSTATGHELTPRQKALVDEIATLVRPGSGAAI
jgi:hypothetical protein